MLSVVSPVADLTAPLARRNPVAKLGAALVLTLTLLVTLDPLSPAVLLTAELAAVPLFGLRYRTLLRRLTPVIASLAGLVFFQLIFGTTRTGTVYLEWGPFTVTTGTLTVASGLALRILAVTVPGVLVVASTDPTDLADGLVQHLRVPARFAIGALAALRLVPLLGAEWRMLSLARRARGIDAGRNPAAQVRLFAATAFALLVGAIRRGIRLGTAMDARGFDAGVPRTYARRQHFTWADVALIAGTAVVSAAALTASVVTGLFHPVLW